MTNPAARATVGSATYKALRSDIIFGRQLPGAKLKLSSVRARYGTSVSTLREAMARLETEGLVVSEGQRGFFVAPMSAADLHEIADLRILLESHALRQSFAAGDTDWEAQIVAAHHRLHRAEQGMAAGNHATREAWKQFDWEFHQSLMMACGSQALLQVHSLVFDKYLRYQMRVLTYRGAAAATEHRQMLESALDRDAERAVALLRQHIAGGLEHSLTSQNI